MIEMINDPKYYTWSHNVTYEDITSKYCIVLKLVEAQQMFP